MIAINQARAAMRQLNVDPDRKYTPRAPQQAVFQAVFRYLRDTHGLAWAEIGDAFKREQNNVSVAAKKATPEAMKRLTDVMNGVKRCPHCQGVL